MKELDYQIEAIEDLRNQVDKILSFSEGKTVIFQAPTGSGKTYMVSEALKRLVKDREDDKKLSFIWVSVRMLHEQSKEKLERYYEDDRLIQCSYFEDLGEKKIGENEILFINWHSINKKDINIYVRENEQDNNLNSIVQNTKEEGREIILVIDESHHTAKSEKSREIIETIGPKVTIEVSATPHIKENIGGWVTVDLGNVKAEEMIKSEIAVNPEFLEMKVGAKDSDTIVIEQGLNKKEELAKLYKKEGASINPLVLIQLPDKKGNLINKKDDVMEILGKKGISEKHGKLAVWLSEEKTDNLANIDKNDNEVEVLVFKQAIAVGWDCPRASILVIFRESKSFTFTIQTIGRIMRMPELVYYNSEELNKGFVFTNLSSIKITEDYARDYVTLYESKRDNQKYKRISLFSVYLKRQRERTRLSGDFVNVFMQVAEKINLQSKITAQPEKMTMPIIADGKIKDVDKPGPIESKGQIDVKLNETELRNIWDRFIYEICSPYAPTDSSDRMKTAIYQFFKKKYRLNKFDPRVQRIVIAKENRQFFIDAINEAKHKYKAHVSGKLSETREKIEVPDWEVPAVISYDSGCKRESHPRSIMKPFYTRKLSEPEQLFMEALDESDKVEWWFKNGETEIKYFAVARTDEGAFYPDFIVKFKDGNIGIFDTKKGRTAKEEDAAPRAEGLQKWIKEQKKKGKNLRGGIVINVQGSWRCNDSKKYEYNPNDLSKWKFLEL